MIFAEHPKYVGILLEFKTPLGMNGLDKRQIDGQHRMKRFKFITITAHDAFDIVRRLALFNSECEYKCDFCGLIFKHHQLRDDHEITEHADQFQKKLAIMDAPVPEPIEI